MVFSTEDLIEIRTLMSIGWAPVKIFEHHVANKYRGERSWKQRAIQKACKRIEDRRGDYERRHGSGRSRKVRTEEAEDRVEAALLSPDDEPGTHLSQRKAARVLGRFLG